jgi:hypothetical protein
MILGKFMDKLADVLAYVLGGVALLVIAGYAVGVMTGISEEEGWTSNMLIGPGLILMLVLWYLSRK